MATRQHEQWVRAGKPFRKAEPVKYMEAYARSRGITVLGTIGNEDHLEAPFPEDHTPFSFTAWPVPLPDYVVTAIDLANERGLGAAILRDARAGRTPWLKYMNVAGKNYAYADGFRTGSPNSDHHIHLSVFSDETWTDVSGYDPLSIPGGSAVSDLEYVNGWKRPEVVGNRPAVVLLAELWTNEKLGHDLYGDSKSARSQQLDRIEKLAGRPTAEVRLSDADRAAIVADLRAALAPDIAEAVKQALREGTD